MKNPIQHLSEFKQRLIAAVIGIIVILNALYWSEWSYFALFFVICLLAQLEFYKLLKLDEEHLPLRTFGTINGLFIYVITFFIEKKYLPADYYYLVFVGLSGAYFIKLYGYKRKDMKPFANIGFTFLGVLYVAVPFALLNSAIFLPDGSYSWQVIMGCLFILWANDTGAYFSGKNFGKHKLFQTISPKKTWEGSIGGGIFAVGIGLLQSFWFTDLRQWEWLGISVIIVVAGTYGDLVESMFKRSINIKDSARTIPGHGGFLDRFDGLLLAAPFITAFLKLI